MIWNVGQPLVAWPEADADGPTRWWSQGEAGTHYVAPSLKRKDGNVGFGAFPTVCKAIPRFSRPKIASGPPSRCRSWPCTSEYLRQTTPLHETLISVDSGTHEQLTSCDTGGQRETPAPPAQRPRPNHGFPGGWKPAE